MARKITEALLRQGAKKMGAKEREACEEELANHKADLAGKEQEHEGSRPDLLQETGRIKHRIKFLEEMLNRDDDLKAASGAERDRLVKQAAELEVKIKKEMLTPRQEALRSHVNPQDFEMAVRQQMAHQKNQLKNIQAWQQIKRRLEPENPMADNVGLLQR